MLQRGVIIHWGKVLKGKPSEIRVTGEIDWGWRHLLMKRHTAGHLLDHCLYEKTGKPVETTDSWLGEGCYVGYRGEAPGKEVLDGIEALANELISRGKKVHVENISHQDLLKRAPMAPNRFRLPKFESYRVVFIDGFELIPCGGTHLRDIREIGSVHLEGSEMGEATYKIYYDVGE